MKESTSVRGSIPASAYARWAPSYISSFQENSGVEGRNGVIPTPAMPILIERQPSAVGEGRGGGGWPERG